MKNFEQAKNWVSKQIAKMGADKGEIINDAANIYGENYDDYCELWLALEKNFGK